MYNLGEPAYEAYLLKLDELDKRFKNGDSNPTPQTSEDIWYLLTNFYAAKEFERLKYEFNQSLATITRKDIIDELKGLDYFVNAAMKTNWMETKATTLPLTQMFVYYKLQKGDYEKVPIKKGYTYPCLQPFSTETQVYAKYFFYRHWLLKQSLQYKPTPKELTITTEDKILLELDIIEKIFKAQLSKYGKNNSLPYPEIWGDDCKSYSDGRYFSGFFDIFSDCQLFEIQALKKEFTNRFETSTNTDIIENYFVDIRNKAFEIRNFYNENLTSESTIVKEFMAKKSGQIENDCLINEYHSAVVSITSNKISGIYLGLAMEKMPNWFYKTEKPFRYLASNYELAEICQQIIDFADRVLNSESNGFSAPSPNSEKEEEIILPQAPIPIINGGLNFLHASVHVKLAAIEDKIQEAKTKWFNKKDKIGCAAFCELLLENNFFLPEFKDKRITAPATFASERYGIEITNSLVDDRTKSQIEGTKYKSRQTHKNRFSRHFKPNN